MVFQCTNSHVICLECFQQYCMSRLNERRFIFDHNIGYTLSCPAGCENSLIEGTQHFKILGNEQYQRLLHFGAEEYVMSTGGVLCPQPGCGMGLLADPSCRRIQCTGGCEVSIVYYFNFVEKFRFFSSNIVRVLPRLSTRLSHRRVSE